MISILQQFTAECIDITGAPENALSNSLYEIELGIQEANKKLNEIVRQGELMRKNVSEQELKSA